MNHQKIYDQLINKRRQNPAVGYTEKHHILPKSMGGSDDPSNLVVLTGREHWIAHLLLYKIHKNQSMAHACHMMAMMCEERGIPRVRNSRMYEYIRKECAEYTSKRMKKHQRGKGNSQYGTQWICNTELKENKKINKNEEIPEGWVKGRNKWKKPKGKNDRRTKLEKQIIITDGVKIKKLIFEDQLPIPKGWKIGIPEGQKTHMKNIGFKNNHNFNNGKNNPMSKENRQKRLTK